MAVDVVGAALEMSECRFQQPEVEGQVLRA